MSLNPEPCKSYSLADRLVCDQCGHRVEILSASGSDPVTVDVSCHGAREKRTLTKRELSFTQRFFVEDPDLESQG